MNRVYTCPICNQQFGKSSHCSRHLKNNKQCKLVKQINDSKQKYKTLKRLCKNTLEEKNKKIDDLEQKYIELKKEKDILFNLLASQK